MRTTLRLLFVLLATSVACNKATESETKPEASKKPEEKAPEAAKPVAAKRPELPGDFKRGWTLFETHCLECHGQGRRGGEVIKDGVLIVPADLRDPMMLASKTDDELAENIRLGIPEKGAKAGAPQKKREDFEKTSQKGKGMPAFPELTKGELMDIVAFMRGDSIYLEETFASATHYLRLNPEDKGPPVLAAFAGEKNAGRPKIVDSKVDLPKGGENVGYVMFLEIDLLGVGQTPIAIVANVQGEPTGVRVGLPEPDNARAQADVQQVLFEGAKGSPRLRSLTPVLEASKSRLKQIVDKSKTS